MSDKNASKKAPERPEEGQGLAMLGFFGFVMVALILAYAANDGAMGSSAHAEESILDGGSAVEAQLDSESMLYVIIPVAQEALFSGFAPDEHVIRALQWESLIRFDDRENPQHCEVELTVPVAGLRVDYGPDREALGLEDELNQGERARIAGDMRSEDQLFEQEFPEIYFRTLQCDRQDDGSWIAAMEVQIRGERARYDTELDLNVEEGRFSVRAEFEGRHQDFGMEPYSAFFGTLRNSEVIEFGIDGFGEF